MKQFFIFAAIILSAPVFAFPYSLSMLVIDGDALAVNRALEGFALPDGVTLRLLKESDLKDSENVRYLKQSNVILVDAMMRDFTDFLAKEGCLNGKRIYALRGSSDDEALKKDGVRFDPILQAYYKAVIQKNIRNLILKVLHDEFDPSIPFEEPVFFPEHGIYHPEAPDIFKNFGEYEAWLGKRSEEKKAQKPVLGLMIFSSQLMDGQVGAVNELVKMMENEGFQVISAFGKEEGILKEIFMERFTHRPRVDAVISFSLKFRSGLSPEVKSAVEALGVPFFNAIHLYSGTQDSWRDDPVGIPPSDVTWKLATPEISGLIEPTPITGDRKIFDRESGREFLAHEVIPETAAALAARIKLWVRLKNMENGKKRWR